MKLNLDVDVHHLTRVEGHGNVRVRVRDGVLEEATWQVVETPRFFEVMMRGKHFSTVPILAARVCGICSIAHCLTSLEATEDAFGLTIPDAAQRLRLLAKHGETLQSHALHLFFLAAPDFLEVPSVLPLVETHPDVVALARRLKGLANRLCDCVAGRTTHPVTLQVGGVSAAPKRDDLLRLRDELARSRDDWGAAAELFRGIEQPSFVRETEFVSLAGEADYPFIGRAVVSTDGVARGVESYLALTNEYVPAVGTSKWCKLSRPSFAVGPLARFNNNADRLQPTARKLASSMGLEPVCHNPFFAHVARLVECVHANEESIRLIDELVEPGAMAPLRTAPKPRAGTGVGAVEAPRGILYHCYEYDGQGRIIAADCVIPTTQNHANIQHDLESLVAELAATVASDAALERLCSMLVRSYDPCISCSVH
jgi:coenzyme F420-reducing hydrogenase alpha subunit